MQVPVVEVQDVDIRRPQLLQARLNAELKALEVVADVVDALLQLRVSGPEVVGVLFRVISDKRMRNNVAERTLVDRMIWSRMPRASIHSPMTASDDPFWL